MTRSIIFKKNIKNARSVTLDNLDINQTFLPPRLTTIEITALQNPSNGSIVYNTDNNELLYYDGTAFRVLVDANDAADYVTLNTAQTITAKKTFSTSTPGALDSVLEVANTGIGGLSGADIGISFNAPNLPLPRKKSIFMDGNTNNVHENGDICFIDIGLGNKIFACWHSQNGNYFMNLPQPESKIKIENVQILSKKSLNLSGFDTNITCSATNSNRIDLGFSLNVATNVNTGIINFSNLADTFFRLDSVQRRMSIGHNTGFLSNIRALFSGGINDNYAILLPRMTTPGELNYISIVGADNQYDGSIWYNKDIHQLRGMFNNQPFNIHHGGTQDINANQIGGNTITNTEYSHLQGITANIQTQLNTKISADSVATITNKSIDADNNTITNISDSAIKIGAGIDVKKLATGLIDNNKFNFLNGVTSDIQTQINNKASLSANTFTGVQTVNDDVNITDSSKTFKINGVNAIQYDITHLDYFSSSTTYSTAVTFVHKLNRPFTNLTAITSSGTATQQFRLINVSTGGTVLVESAILPIGINATTVVIGGLTPINNAVLQCQVRLVTGSGSVSFSGANID